MMDNTDEAILEHFINSSTTTTTLANRKRSVGRMLEDDEDVNDENRSATAQKKDSNVSGSSSMPIINFNFYGSR